MADLNPRAPTSDDVGRLDAAIDGIGIDPAFQPIVALPGEQVIGFEALARWPVLDDPRPQRVFAHATDHGGLDRLDQTCIKAALRGALHDDQPVGTLLMVNCEPTSAYVGPTDFSVLERARNHFRVTFEFTERSLLAHPRALLRKLADVRADGFFVALDDGGAHPDSLAWLDVIRPDIVKLDLALVQSNPSRDQARTMSAVLAHHERTGAVILAEGIETDDHLEQALALGATLGQGFKFGPAGAIDDEAMAWTMPSERNLVGVESRSPFEVVTETHPIRTARKDTLVAFSRHIETQAWHAADPPMLMAALQRGRHLTPATHACYEDLATRLPLVAVFGADLPEDPGSGLRYVPLAPSDPLCREWAVVMLGPHTAAALLAREQDSPDAEAVPDHERRFDLVMTHDRALVTSCARSLLDRMR